ncbi:CoA transferase [Actinotalea sp. K2]|uniref:CoA transferase n=1 Tax=Actinotalea sp. K2 TaxID=2939438 RepID=UPI002017CD52|nr:CoA transferase [Actinotalea sp. K2]MCL3860920.1 CoA transferase [Actinotalea sp. K2]
MVRPPRIDPVTDALLRHAWRSLGGAPDAPRTLRPTGPSAGLLPGRHRTLPMMVAAVGAATLAAATLDQARRGTPSGPVTVDVGHVALAARSERYAHGPGTGGEPFAPLSRFWRTREGWLRLHTNYPWHRERALEVLGCEGLPDAVAQAVARWSGPDLEDALAAHGGVGAAVRRPEEWAAHPQGRAVAGLPLVDRRVPDRAGQPRADDGATTTAPRGGDGLRAAQGVRVLDLTRVIAGPVATRTLAAWGADVLRVDSPRLPELPAQLTDTLVGKRSTLLDLTDPHGCDTLHELLSAADVLVHGYRPGALDAFGLGGDALAMRHPHLNVVAVSAWGHVGPWRARRGFDSLVQCSTGIAAVEGDGDGAPGTLPAQALDHATGYLAAAAAMLATARTVHGGMPTHAHLSLAATAQWLTGAGTDPAPAGPPGRQGGGALRGDDAEASVGEHLCAVPGAASPVEVVAPPGRLTDLAPGWASTTTYGSDPARFADRPRLSGRS